jgi:Mg2+/Co2+ transporter CorC
MISFLPFKTGSDAVTLGSLKVENREDHIAIYGSLAITRDRSGLAGAKALKDILERIIKELEDGHDQPVRVAVAAKAGNPSGQA